MKIIGIGGYLGHDSSAALVVDGSCVAAAQEERFTRNKHAKGVPHHAIDYCLGHSGLSGEDIDEVVFTEQPHTVQTFNLGGGWLSRFGELADRKLSPGRASGFHRETMHRFPKARARAIQHHLTHIAASHLLSGMETAAFLCVDGKGENYSATIGRASTNTCEILEKHRFENGLGMFYSAVTKYLGFLSFGDEYKVMGLAPYGSPVHTEALRRMFTSNSNGQFRMLRGYTWKALDAIREISDLLGYPMRLPEEPIEQRHKDVAASLQKIFEDEIFKMAARAKKLCTDEESLVFSGGCAQNCVVGGKLGRSGIFDSIYVSPVASDMSSALGAAVHGAQLCDQSVDPDSFRSLYLGPQPGAVPAEATPHRLEVTGDLHAFIAQKISEGLSVAWVRGGMELGPRALGARSILADPRDANARNRLNRKIKFRESFRPFAPAILAERVSDWFEFNGRADYMNLTAQLRSDRRNDKAGIPSVIHIDHSARLQTVHPDVHPDLHQLIQEFENLTGVPILINTSFNLAGEPIVCSAKDAWETFVRCDLDLLVVGDEVFEQPDRVTGP